MKRSIIIIKDKAVIVTGNEVWMTAWEIAELFNVTVRTVNAAIRAILKSGVLNSRDVCRYVQLDRGLYADVHSLETIIAVAFRLNTCPAHLFRRWLAGKALAKERNSSFMLFLQSGKGIRC